MTLGRLKELQKELNIPDEAVIYVYTDHGQCCEMACDVDISRSDNLEYEDMRIWEYQNYKEIYDDDALEEYDENGSITAICITGN